MGKTIELNLTTIANGLSFKGEDALSILDANGMVGVVWGLYGSTEQTILRGEDSTRSSSFVNLEDYIKLYDSITITPRTGYKFVPIATDRTTRFATTSVTPFAWNTSAVSINFSSMRNTIYDSLAFNVAKVDNTDVEDVPISTYIEISFS